MTLNKYLEYLSKYAEKYGHLDIVYSEDDEGNYYSKVSYPPTLGNFMEGEFIDIDNFLNHFEEEDFESTEKYINAICVN